MSDVIQLVSPLERALYLKTLPFFNALDAPELATMAAAAEEIHAGGGQMVVDVDEAPDAFFHIVRGSVSVEGIEFPRRASLAAGRGFGFLSALARDEVGLDAKAERDCILLRFDIEALLDVAEANFYVLHQFATAIGRQVFLERRVIADGTHLGAEASRVPDVERDLTTVERLIALSTISSFRDSGLDGLAKMSRNLPERRYEAGEQLWSRGDPSGHALLLLSGRVRATQRARSTTFTCGPGYPLGNIETLAGEKRWYDAVAETPIRCLVTNPERFFDVLEDDFVMAQDFLANMAKNLISIRWENQLSTQLAAFQAVATR
jgi:CRP-like cAMP-binding protein